MTSFTDDSVALASAASAAEEALQLEREALSVLRDSWDGESATAATDFIDSHCREGEAVVSALRRAAAVLASLGDSLDGPGDPITSGADQIDAGLADRTPSNFAAPMPPAAPAPAPAMNWPSSGMPTLPDLGGALADLIAQAADSLGADPAADPTSEDPPADPAQPAAPDPAPDQPAAVVSPPMPGTNADTVESVPLLAAEVPPAEIAAVEPAPPAGAEPPVEPPDADRTPCEIAADELPQVGQ